MWSCSNFRGKIGQTTRAHRLLLKAWNVAGMEKQQKLLGLFFKAWFEEGQCMADADMLARCVEKAGVMPHEQALDFLETDECAEEVDQIMNDARMHGVTGVPFTVINGKWAISGAHDADVYCQVSLSASSMLLGRLLTCRPVYS
jgi:predicted DsbA family dithiol-disulfide isomerase